jgi:hypothetical protein
MSFFAELNSVEFKNLKSPRGSFSFGEGFSSPKNSMSPKNSSSPKNSMSPRGSFSFAKTPLSPKNIIYPIENITSANKDIGRSRSVTLPNDSNSQIARYQVLINVAINNYKKSGDPKASEIIDTFYFISNKISIFDSKKPGKLNNIIEDYLTLIQKLTIITEKSKFSIVQLL